MERFIEITFKGEVIALVNTEHIVSIVDISDMSVALTLTTGKPIYTDMTYKQVKDLVVQNNDSYYNNPDVEISM